MADTMTTGQFVEEVKKVLGEGIDLIAKVAVAKSNQPISNSTDSRRDVVNQELTQVLGEGFKEFAQAEQVLRAGVTAQAAAGGMQQSGIFSMPPAEQPSQPQVNASFSLNK